MEARHRERLKYWIPATGRGVGVEEVLGVCWPESLVELQKDLGIGSELELVDCGSLPLGQFRREGDHVVLENSK